MPLKVQVVTPERELLVEDDATFISVRALGGDMGIMPGIAPQLAALGTGPVKIHADGRVRTMLVDGGFLIVKDDRCTILAEYAVTPDEIDATEVSAEIEDLKRRIQTETETEQLRKELARREAMQGMIQVG
jgi:F-type H+-transporting ATPase subunit epsilon